MSIIDIKHLYKSYKTGNDTFYALKDISFKVDAGEYLAIVGTSGSGKSSLMNILGCLDPIELGTYSFAGRDISEYDDQELASLRNREIGFIFQSYNLLPKSTLIENVSLPLIYSSIGEDERLEMAAKTLTHLGLGDRLDHLPGDISGGQRQRVAIARALVTQPSVILADEPTGNLDSVTQREIIELFRTIRDEFNTTVIVVTHDEEVAYYSDRIITLFDGYLFADIDLKQTELLYQKEALREIA